MSSVHSPRSGNPFLPCQRCGKPLHPSETPCSNCGYPNAAAQKNAPSIPDHPGISYSHRPYTQRPFPAASHNAERGVQQAPLNQTPPAMFALRPRTGQLTNSIPGQPNIPLQISGNNAPFNGGQPINNGNIPGTPSPYMAQSNNNFYGPPPQNSSYPIGPANGSTSWNREPLSSRRRIPKPALVLFIGIAICVLIGGGITVYALTQGGNDANVPTTRPQGTPLFADAFANNNKGWDLQSAPGHFSVMVGNGSMVLEDDDHTLLWELVPGGKMFGNFQLNVDAVLSKGDQGNGYGIYIRGTASQNSQLASYYRFALYGDGSYAVFKGSVDNNGNSVSSRLVEYMKSAAIKKQGERNQIALIAQGSSMTFMVNGQTLKTIIDKSYMSGAIALYVANLQDMKAGAQATFSHFAIYAS